LNRESARKLSLVISLIISDLLGYSLGISANWRASASIRRNSVSTVGLSECKLLGSWPQRPSFFCILWISSRTVPTCESSSAIASAPGSPFRIAVYCRVNSAKRLFTIFKTMGEDIVPAFTAWCTGLALSRPFANAGSYCWKIS
jgi:hypothetical protein